MHKYKVKQLISSRSVIGRFEKHNKTGHTAIKPDYQIFSTSGKEVNLIYCSIYMRITTTSLQLKKVWSTSGAI